jgi:4a-hydroxytetrahydrobiopterin dehydratase
MYYDQLLSIQTSMSTELANKRCIENGARKLKPQEISTLRKKLSGWKLVKGKLLEKTYKFPDFTSALAFTNRVGYIAEQQGHHPDILLTYGGVRTQITTHSARGLTENDFILAAKVDQLD